MDKVYAHSPKDKKEDREWHLLDDHIKSVACKSYKFAGVFDSSDWAYNIGFLHDLGKASSDFQEYLKKVSSDKISDEARKCIKKTNHSGAGAIYAIEKFKDPIGRVIAYCVAGHHAGLLDWYSEETANAALSARLKNDKKYFELIKDYINNNTFELKDNLSPPRFINQEKDLHLWIRMLYSCLVDADFLDTEEYLDKDKLLKRSKFSSISELSSKFFDYMKDFEKGAETSSINKVRSEVLRSCEESAIKKEGFWELSVPTGGGKTLSAMAFAFKHAVKFSKERIIYVIPYTSIIEQTSKKLREILGDDNVVEHHSNIDSDKETEEMRLACENWDAPIIVTTNVQFFESLYSARSSRCRKLHNIVNSVIILDEAQLLPPNFLYPCVEVLKQLVINYKTTILFSTATQPVLPGICGVNKVVRDSAKLYDRLRRVNYVFPKDFSSSSWESVCEKLKEHKQVLCVVNTRRDCYDLFKLMPKGTIHLSALMCAEHRTKKIGEIKDKLKRNEEIRVVSTQLIEAGVDIDFPVVYRAFAGIPSIIQTAGRCNREGKLPVKEANVFVFVPPSKLPQGVLSKAADVTRDMISSENFQIDNEDTPRRFYEKFYKSVNSIGEDWLKNLLIKDAYNGEFQFSTAGKEFQIIDDNCNISIIVKYGKNDDLIEEFRVRGPSRDLMRKLQRYIVNVPGNIFFELKNKGLIEEIYETKYLQGQIKYSEETGLNIFEMDIIDLPII